MKHVKRIDMDLDGFILKGKHLIIKTKESKYAMYPSKIILEGKDISNRVLSASIYLDVNSGIKVHLELIP